MSDAESGSTRRRVLKTAAGATLGTVIGTSGLILSYGLDDGLPITIELAQTSQLGDRAVEEHGDREYALDRMREYTEAVVGDLLERAGLPEPEIRYSELEPVQEHDGIRAVQQDWDLETGGDASVQLLLTDQAYDGAVGVGEQGYGDGDCLCGVDAPHSDSSVLGEAYDLLEIEPGDVREEIIVSDYDLETGSRHIHYTPHKTAIAGVHEIGHNLCLGHEDGHVEVVDRGIGKQIQTSVMGASYTQEYAAGDGVEIRAMDDLYWEAAFSDRAVRELEEQYAGLL